ncbi:hypothetical protein JOC95_003896 [Bacillus tianshenii]|uniref:Uncharacterized protein n=1 Tax=Sutcliffiella tianshenii TaxID=1463404 RepID=A0ABS2P5X9_9BACI|nr:hypothetical protein [Bacillus tianshenii]
MLFGKLIDYGWFWIDYASFRIDNLEFWIDYHGFSLDFTRKWIDCGLRARTRELPTLF